MYMDANNDNVKLKSSFLEYLPALFDSDEFMARFLHIFEDITRSIMNTINNLPLYFDPAMTPEPFLQWLASWVDLALDPMWPVEKRRELLKSATELYRWRGTKRGLAEYLRIYTGTTPEITEHIEGMKLHLQTELGVNSQLGSSSGGNHFTVTLELDEDSAIDMNRVIAIIEAQKPAHSIYTLKMK
ncbi:phage tail protein [Chloroflexota bacterium]